MVLRLENVVKNYEGKTAVDNVSFEMPEASIFGLLGPNGAGKTSLIRIITNITRADSGRVWLNGELINSQNAAHIGYMPEERGLYKKMKVGEHLMYLAQLKDMTATAARTEILQWLTKFGIKDWWNKTIEELSKGMQQKVQFVATVVHRPKLLILDEPFSGLDPLNATLIQNEIFELHRGGTSIIFSTHRMEQVEEICDRIVLIHQGKNVLEGEVTELKNRFKENLFCIEYEGELPAQLTAQLDVVSQKNNVVTLRLGTPFTANDVLEKFIQHKTPIRAFRELLPSLNEIFIRQVSGTYPSHKV